MKLSFGYVSHLNLIVSIAVITSIILTGCDRKISQCQQIISVANSVVKETKAITKSKQEENTDAWLKAADKLEKAAQRLQKMKITEAKLQEYKSGFIEVYQRNSQLTYQAIEAWKKQDLNTIITTQKNVQKVGKLEREIGNKIEQYCSSNS